MYTSGLYKYLCFSEDLKQKERKSVSDCQTLRCPTGSESLALPRAHCCGRRCAYTSPTSSLSPLPIQSAGSKMAPLTLALGSPSARGSMCANSTSTANGAGLRVDGESVSKMPHSHLTARFFVRCRCATDVARRQDSDL